MGEVPAGGKNIALASSAAPSLWYRRLHFMFGYAAVIFGVYMLINGIMYSR
jgi:hypothetical protein